MNSLAAPLLPATATSTSPWLLRLGRLCLWIMVIGQTVFALYVARVHLAAMLAGQPEQWNRVLPHGYVAADPLGNAMLGMHLVLAVLFIAGGALQLLPRLRRAAPAVHRWNGRAYLLAASLLALGGLWLVWVRGGVVGDLSQHLAISVNALLILFCAGLAWRHARARQFSTHRRWALRLFVVASGVWYFRIGLMAWVVFHRGPVGFDPKTFSGPFLTSLALAAYVLVPLTVLQLYFAAAERSQAALRTAAIAVLALVALFLLVGSAAASLGMWLPRMV